MVKNLPASAGDVRDWGSIPRSGRSHRGRHGSSLQYSSLENPVDGEPRGTQSRGHKELYMTEATQHVHTRARTHSITCLPSFL